MSCTNSYTSTNLYCNDYTQQDLSTVSQNQLLTMQKPVYNRIHRYQTLLPPRIYDIEIWRNNDLIDFSNVTNKPGEQEMLFSGMIPNDSFRNEIESVPLLDGSSCVPCSVPLVTGPFFERNYVPPSCEQRTSCEARKQSCANAHLQPDPMYPKSSSTGVQHSELYEPVPGPYNENKCEESKCQFTQKNNKKEHHTSEKCSTRYEYLSRDADVESLKQYSTQIIQPGMYFRRDVVDPTITNLGISETRRDLPTIAYNTGGGNTMFEDVDMYPELVKQTDNVDKDYYNVYDPRLSGYASNDRMYIDEMTGQPRYAYFDIDRKRKQDVIFRSNIDHLGWDVPSGDANREVTEGILDMRTQYATGLARRAYGKVFQNRMYPKRGNK